MGSQFDFTRSKFDERDWPRFLAANKAAHENYDYDSGWIATPASKSVTHGLGSVPRHVQVFQSTNATGDPYTMDSATSIGSTSVAFTGPAAYCRVVISK